MSHRLLENVNSIILNKKIRNQKIKDPFEKRGKNPTQNLNTFFWRIDVFSSVHITTLCRPSLSLSECYLFSLYPFTYNYLSLICENNKRTLEFIIDLVNIYFTQHLSILVFLISYIHQYQICIVSTQTHRELQFVCLFVLLNSVISLRVCILSWKILAIYFDPIRGVRPPNSVNKSTSTMGVDSVEKQRNFMSMTL